MGALRAPSTFQLGAHDRFIRAIGGPLLFAVYDKLTVLLGADFDCGDQRPEYNHFGRLLSPNFQKIDGDEPSDPQPRRSQTARSTRQS
jgi:hypothetical protein